MRLILFAPNVHTGGGFILLKNLLSASNLPQIVLFADSRVCSCIAPVANGSIIFVQPTLFSRFKAQWQLRGIVCSDDVVLCLQSTPLLFKVAGRVIVFQQNRLLLNQDTLSSYPVKNRINIIIDRIVSRLFRNRVKTWVVQTKSMQKDLEFWHGNRPDVRVLPFLDTTVIQSLQEKEERIYDFVYVSDGMPHKNHIRLLDAWKLLSLKGMYPTLALTLGKRDAKLAKAVLDCAQEHDLRVVNLGCLDHCEVMALYHRSKALVFPSTAESFGLPLVEAAACGLPIVASELDYVRDVCSPAATFDPFSAVSISRAVQRFMGAEEPLAQLCSANDFVREVCR